MLQWLTYNQFTTFSKLHERKRGSYNQLQIITTVDDNKYFGLKDERVKKWMTLTYFSFVNNNTSLVNVLANLYYMSLEWKNKSYEDHNYKTLSPFLFGITNYHVISNIMSQFFVFTIDWRRKWRWTKWNTVDTDPFFFKSWMIFILH